MSEQKEPARRFTRRRLLAGGLAGLGSVAAGGVYATQIEPFWPTLQRVPMHLPNLGAALCGLKVVHVSDLHISGGMPLSYLRKQLAFCASLAPDLLVMTGDFVTRGDPSRMGELAALVRTLRAPHGIFAVLGNHDYNRFQPAGHADSRAQRSANLIAATLSANGVQVLRNESRTIAVGPARLQLAGVDEYWSGNYNPPAAFAAIDPQLPCVALCHNPDAIDDLRHLPCHWILAGHTHGGQVRLPLLGAPVLPMPACSRLTASTCTSTAGWVICIESVSTAAPRSLNSPSKRAPERLVLLTGAVESARSFRLLRDALATVAARTGALGRAVAFAGTSARPRPLFCPPGRRDRSCSTPIRRSGRLGKRRGY
jgi:predicted MPP superfamily phosphohydrolase